MQLVPVYADRTDWLPRWLTLCSHKFLQQMEREKSGRTRIKTSGEKQKSDRQCGRGMMAASPRLFFFLAQPTEKGKALMYQNEGMPALP